MFNLHIKESVVNIIKHTYVTLFSILFFFLSFPYTFLFRYLLVISLVASLFLMLVEKINPLKPFSKIFVLSIYFIALSFSLIWTENVSEGLKIIERSLSFIIIPILFIPLSKSNINISIKEKLILFSYGLIFSIFFGYIYEFLYELYFPKNEWIKYITKNEVSYFFHNVVLKIDFHHSYLSLYCLLGAIFLLFIKVDKRKLLNTIGGFFLLMHPLLFMSRIGTILSFFVFFVWCYRNYKKLYSIIILLLLALVLSVNKKSVFNRFDNISEVFADSNRKLIWDSSLELIKTNYILGLGVGDVQDLLLQKYEQKSFTKGLTEKYNVHNQYLQTYLSAGVFGMTALLSVFLLGFIIAKKSNELRIVYYGILVLIMISFVTESMLQRERGIFLFCIMLSVIFFSNYNTKTIDK